MNCRHFSQFLAILLISSATIACAPITKDGQPASGEQRSIIQQGWTAGQTFTARDRGLNGIDVFLSPQAPGNGEILLHLRADPQAQTDLAISSLHLQQVIAPGFYHFTFPPQSGSRNQDYYLLIDLQGYGSVGIGTASGDAYLDGALYQNGDPVDAQMRFQLAYDPIGLLVGIAELAASWLLNLSVSLLLFVLPGYALCSWLFAGWRDLSFGERLGMAAGLCIALYPLLMLWTHVFGLHLGALYAWLPISVAIAVILWRNRSWRPARSPTLWYHWPRSEWKWHDITLAVILVLVFGVRFWVIRSVSVPMWGDSYQHTMITQLVVDNGGLFDSWQPYADLSTFTYHFGFHAAAAAFYWVSRLPIPQSVLWTGQILNALAVLALYPVATRVGGSRWAGVVAVLVAGLLSPMPMEYVNWGRYTQLAGQVILPVAVYLGWETLDAKQRDWRLIGLTWIALSGLALTHYRVLIFAIIFYIALVLIRRKAGRVVVARAAVLASGSILLFLPWFIHIFAGKLGVAFTTLVGTPVVSAPVSIQEYNAAVGDISLYLPSYLWLSLPLCIAWGLWKRQKGVSLLGLWWAVVLLATNPQWLGLPGQGVLSNFAVLIAIYIPASLIIGSVLGALIKTSLLRGAKSAVLISILIAMAGLWGVQQRLKDLRITESTLVTQPDVRAADWIRQNTPAKALFLVNSFFAYGDTLVVGSDGGWWLPLLSGRQTTLPPLTYSNEQGPRPDYREWVRTRSVEIRNSEGTPDFGTLLRDRGISYIYIGQRQGRVNYDGPGVLRPEQLLASSQFRPVYHQDRVWIFEVVS